MKATTFEEIITDAAKIDATRVRLWPQAGETQRLHTVIHGEDREWLLEADLPAVRAIQADLMRHAGITPAETEGWVYRSLNLPVGDRSYHLGLEMHPSGSREATRDECCWEVTLRDDSTPTPTLEQLGFDERERRILDTALELRDDPKTQRLGGGLIVLNGNNNSGVTDTLRSLCQRFGPETAFIGGCNEHLGFGNCFHSVSLDDFGPMLRQAMDATPACIAVESFLNDEETLPLCLAAVEAGNRMIATSMWDALSATLVGMYASLGATSKSEERKAAARILDSVRAIAGHWRVPLLCPHCRVELDPKEHDEYDVFPAKGRTEENHWTNLKRPVLRTITIGSQKLTEKFRRSSRGCPKCKHLGYRDSKVLFEVLEMTPEAKQMIREDICSHSAPVTGVVQQGGRTIMQQGIELFQAHEITFGALDSIVFMHA